jgi:hypothetical protein
VAPARPTTPTVFAPLEIRGVGVEPKTLNATTQREVSIRYELTQAAAMTVDLVDEGGRLVHRFTSDEQPAGMHVVHWNGHDGQGRPVPDGVYRYMLMAQTPEGQSVTYDPSRAEGGEELQPGEFAWDRHTGRIQWVMPRAGYARLSIKLQGFPYLRTLLDWQPLEGGAHEVHWDGSDSSGWIRAGDHPDVAMTLNAFAMPPNTVIVRAGAAQVARDIAPSYPPMNQRDGVAFHARHPRAVCHDVRLRVEFPEATQRDEAGRPILHGVVPVRVTLDARDAPHLINQKFEIALFEDLTILLEEEEAMNPFTCHWDTTHLTPGQHLLTVNVMGYDDHYGVDTQPVIIGATP